MNANAAAFLDIKPIVVTCEVSQLEIKLLNASASWNMGFMPVTREVPHVSNIQVATVVTTVAYI